MTRGNSRQFILWAEYPHQLLQTGDVMTMGWNSSRSRLRTGSSGFISRRWAISFILTSWLLHFSAFSLAYSPFSIVSFSPHWIFLPLLSSSSSWCWGKEANRREGLTSIILKGAIVAINQTSKLPLLTLPPWTFLLGPPLGMQGRMVWQFGQFAWLRTWTQWGSAFDPAATFTPDHSDYSS